MNKREVFNAIQEGRSCKLKKKGKLLTLKKGNSTNPTVESYFNDKLEKSYTEEEFIKSRSLAIKDIIFDEPKNQVELSEISKSDTLLEKSQPKEAEIKEAEKPKNLEVNKTVEPQKLISVAEEPKKLEQKKQIPQFEYKFEDNKVIIIGDYRDFCDKKGNLNSEIPIKFVGAWSDFKIDNSGISAIASNDDCELIYKDETIYKKFEKLFVFWNFGTEKHDGTINFKRDNESIQVWIEDNKTHLTFEEGTINLQNYQQIKEDLLKLNYNVTDYTIFE